MSTLLDAEIVNVLVLAAVLEADLGSHRKIGRFRILRPLVLAAAIVPLFLEKGLHTRRRAGDRTGRRSGRTSRRRDCHRPHARLSQRHDR